MTLSDLRSMTVIQLRKVARENQIVLGAGMEKASIVEKIARALSIPEESESVSSEPIAVQPSLLDLPELSREETEAAPLKAEASAPSESKPQAAETPEQSASAEAGKLSASPAPEVSAPNAPEEKSPAGTGEARFQAAWHSPDAGAHSGQHASYSSTGTARPAWMNTTPSGRPLTPEQRTQPLRPHSFGPRFGPASSKPAAPAAEAATPAERPIRPSRPSASPLPDHRIGFTGGGTPFGPGSSSASVSAAPAPAAPASTVSAVTEMLNTPFQEASSGAPTLEELLSAGEYEEGGGILELHPDGYGFLRAQHFMPSSRDIYVSMAQIRRFSLRTGDYIQGKIRPQREGDKYAALLYIDTVNGLPEEESIHRPVFDELTPVYPSRRMSLETRDGSFAPDMRLIDLIAPLGFGQRGLLLCPPDSGKRELLKHYANTISANYPEANVLVLLIDMTPEDVTEFRESVSCPVLASTFDLAPEAHLRLTEMVVERAMRLVEQKKDVIILADSLTRLAKVYTSSAVQQGRSLPGMVNPASLLRAKRMFGAARALKEGGSLTVIATMDIASGNKVDDSVVEEFKGTANMELMLDASLARAGISPAIQLQNSYTKNSDLLLNDREKEGLSLIRQMLGSSSSAVAIPQLVSMMEKTSTNSDLLLKMKDWFALMNM